MKNKILLSITLFVATFLERTLFDLGPNVELVTMTLLLSSAYLGTKWSLSLVFLVLFTTDLVIGNTNIYLFTWSGFLLPVLFLPKIFNTSKINKTLLGTTLGLTSNIFFFVWSNFGVWALDSWNMYANNFSGLTTSYVMGIPFLKLQLLSTILIVPISFTAIELIINFKNNPNLSTPLQVPWHQS